MAFHSNLLDRSFQHKIIALLSAILGKTHLEKKDFKRCRKLQFSRKVRPSRVFLVIAPASVLYNWDAEFKRWGYFVVKRFHRKDEREIALSQGRRGKPRNLN